MVSWVPLFLFLYPWDICIAVAGLVYNLDVVVCWTVCKTSCCLLFTAIALSEDHKPNRSDERKRIESAGGIVMWAGKVYTNHTKYTYMFHDSTKRSLPWSCILVAHSGKLTSTGTWRVGGVLAMSRAFGNRLLKQFVIADPEIQVTWSAPYFNTDVSCLICNLWHCRPNLFTFFFWARNKK